MAAGLGQLGLAPHVFWSMTPKELDAALRGRFNHLGTSQPLERGILNSLMAQFPDQHGKTS